MKKQRRLEPQDSEQESKPTLESFSEEPEDFEIEKENESEIPEEIKRRFKIVLVTPSVVIFDVGGTNGFIEKSKIANKNPIIGEYIEI